jgi:hypothetical protein
MNTVFGFPEPTFRQAWITILSQTMLRTGKGFRVDTPKRRQPAGASHWGHRIRDPKTKGPVIVVQGEREGETVEGNEFLLYAEGQYIGRVVFDKKGLAACDTHEVRAWVELESNVAIVKPGETVPIAPIAYEKKPNKKIKVSK